MAKVRDYYKEIDDVLTEYENHKSWHIRNIDWACNRITWCWRWEKSRGRWKSLRTELSQYLTKNLCVD